MQKIWRTGIYVHSVRGIYEDFAFTWKIETSDQEVQVEEIIEQEQEDPRV